jgi:flagellar biosynthetic protein FliO
MMMMTLIGILAEVPTVPATPSSSVDFTWLFVKMLLILGIVCLFAILLLRFAVPRFSLFKRMQQGSLFRVVARQGLDTGRSLCVVEMGKTYLVLGVADHGISLIKELSAAEFEELSRADRA